MTEGAFKLREAAEQALGSLKALGAENGYAASALRAALEEEAVWLDETAKYLASFPGMVGSVTTHMNRAKSIRATLAATLSPGEGMDSAGI